MDKLGRTHVELTELVNTRLWLPRLLSNGGTPPPGGSAGRHLTRRHGQSSEFDQVRDYQHGDDARHIDWRASARASTIQTRLFHRERDRPVLILVEQGPAMFFASNGNFKSVQAALLASLFAWTANSVHDRVGGLVFGQGSPALTPPARHRQGTLRLLHSIYQANRQLYSPLTTNTDNPLQQVLEDCQPHVLPGTLLILVCSESHLDTSSSQQLATLASMHDSIWLPVSDPLEHQLPRQRHLAFSGTNAQLLLLKHLSATARLQWQQQADALRHNWQQLASQHRALLLPICTSSSLAAQAPGLQEALHAARA